MGSVPQELATAILDKNDVWKMQGAGNDLHQKVHGPFWSIGQKRGWTPDFALFSLVPLFGVSTEGASCSYSPNEEIRCRNMDLFSKVMWWSGDEGDDHEALPGLFLPVSAPFFSENWESFCSLEFHAFLVFWVLIP